MKLDLELSHEIVKTPRIMQVSSLFDLPVEEKIKLGLHAELPVEDRSWNIGLMVGPSGAGKSTLAANLWPDAHRPTELWAPGRSVIDDFPLDMGIRDIVGYLTAVGLGSPPAWVRPYSTLSTGEKFRADVARALAVAGDRIVVIDEFTSTVDRQVAKIASHAVQKTVRRTDRQMIAVTCHYDVLDWLQPDWVYDVNRSSFEWRSVQPHPPVELRIFPCERAVWPSFARHHYLSAKIHTGAVCFGAWIGDTQVAFTSYRHFPHPSTKNIKMGHRLVVLPDYQGMGIAGRLDDWLGQYLYERGYRYRNVVSHPAMIRFYSVSPRWRLVSRPSKTVQNGRPSEKQKHLMAYGLDPRRLSTQSFEYTPPRNQIVTAPEGI